MSLPQLGEAIASDYEEALAFRAPYLIERVIEEGIATTVDEAEALFLEVKRYIVMSHACTPRWGVPANSCRVDEVWHNFVLFTQEYADYCQQHFGRFMNHAPTGAPIVPGHGGGGGGGEPPPPDPDRPKTFRDHYRAFFGVEMSDLWRDELHVTIHRRAVAKMAGMSLRDDGDDVRLVDASGKDVFGCSRRYRPALQLMLTCQPFFVRELPGDLADEEKVALVSKLIEGRRVRIY